MHKKLRISSEVSGINYMEKTTKHFKLNRL